MPLTSMPEPPFSDRLVRALADARRVAILTGAGTSAESGVPTFRDPGGLWERFRPEELANVEAFLRNPALVQGWYTHRREIVQGVEPNAGHYALAELERLLIERGGEFLLATQNVDNLHQRAGSERVVELHGNLTRTYCHACDRTATPEEVAALAEDGTLRCSACRDGLLRPDVVWFGEMLPMEAFEAAMDAAARCDVFLSIGTSGVVYPAAGIPLVAAEAGAFVVELNVEPSAMARQMTEVVIGPSGAVLPALVEAVAARR